MPQRQSVYSRPLPPHATYYDVLEVPVTATDDDIKSAYRRLVMCWHPDKYAAEEHLVRSEAEHTFKQTNEAYTHLKTCAARAHYDRVLRLQSKARSTPGPSQPKGTWGQFWNWLTMLESNKR